MSIHQLLLVPEDANAVVDHTRLTSALRSIGLIEGLMPQGGNHFQPGENFLQLVIFLGCSPVVSLGVAGATADICHVELPPPTTHATAYYGSNLKKPRCPQCRSTLEDAAGIMRAWHEAALDSRLTCPNCGEALDIARLNWRQSAGFARSLVRIWGIFEGEAVPSEELLATLREVAGVEWSYFYVNAKG